MMTPRPVATVSLSLALLLAVSSVHLSFALNEHEDLFPPNDEYDHKVLDPNSVYGSPYGGFARAARSRLARLPLILPGSEKEEENNNDPVYMTVTDGDGRRYACRTYSEDDIARRSLSDSFLDQVVMKPPPTKAGDKEIDDAPIPEPTPFPATVFPTEQRNEATQFEMLAALKQLKGVCTQVHMGWWSYEWCYDQQVRQFHIEIVDPKDAAAKKVTSSTAATTPTNDIKMESITSLGKYQRRQAFTMAEVEEQNNRRHAEKLVSPEASDAKKAIVAREALERLLEPMVMDEQPLGIVIDYHVGGTVCPSSQKFRTTEVEYRCCSPQAIVELKPFVMHKGTPIPSDIASIVKLEEPTTCNYHLIVCTPLLCNGLAEEYEDGPQPAFSHNKKGVQKTWYGDSNRSPSVAASKTKKKVPIPSSRNNRKRKEDESIRDTIERTMDSVCLRTSTNEWWAYEFCHGHHVRQYHEGKKFDPKTGVTTLQMEAMYLLGKYDADRLESFEREDEIKYVVNVTELERATASAAKAATTSQRGSGAYFYQEYMNGQECDGNDPDVGTKGGVPRATTVRFYCGPKFELSNVNEDATCHYVVDVTIPDLCEHPVFRKPADKKNIIKCLPLDDDL